MTALLGVRRLSWAPLWRRRAPLQQRTEKQLLETMRKFFFKKREIGSGKRRLRVAKAGKEKSVLGTTGR